MPNTMCIPQTPSHPHRLASLGSTYYSQVDMLGVRYKSVNFGARKSPDSPRKNGIHAYGITYCRL